MLVGKGPITMINAHWRSDGGMGCEGNLGNCDLRGWGGYRPESLEGLRCGAVWGVVRASVGLP